MGDNLIFEFIKKHLIVAIFSIIAFLFGIISVIISKDVQDFFQKKYDKLYFSTIGKKRFNKIKDAISKELYNVTNDADLIKEFKFSNSIELGTTEYGILKIDKFEDKRRTQESFILQIPLASAFYNERGALEIKYRDSLFDALAGQIAINLKREDVFRMIKENAERDKRLDEFNQLSDILNEFDKRDFLINEMRRRYTSKGRDIGTQSQMELSRFIVGMSKEKAIVILVDTNIKGIKNSVENALFKSKYDSVYLFARDSHIPKLDKAVLELKKSHIINIEDKGEYEWHYRDKKIGRGKTVIINKTKI